MKPDSRPQEAKGIRVTVCDLETGEEEVAEVVNDWLLTTAGDYYLHHIQKYANGTVLLTIKRAPLENPIG